ncbi:MAG: flagellar protein FlaG [Thermodesulfobacteriota bacterium]
MNIQNAELPKEAVAQAVDAERAVRAVAQRDEQVRPAREQEKAGDGEYGDEGGQLGRKDAEQILRKAQEYFNKKGVDLNFRLLDDSKKLQVEVVDAQSHKVIRKIPEDEIVTLSDNLKKMAKGVLDKSV